RATWYDVNVRVIRIARNGSIACWGTSSVRLSLPLYDLAEAIDAYNGTEGGEPEVRIAAWAPVQAALKRATGEDVRTDDQFLRSLTVYQAGAVALDIFETSDGPSFHPVVMGRDKASTLNDDAAAPEGDDDSEAAPGQRDIISDALLPPDLQRRFQR